jgi:hypothetical protein
MAHDHDGGPEALTARLPADFAALRLGVPATTEFLHLESLDRELPVLSHQVGPVARVEL